MGNTKPATVAELDAHRAQVIARKSGHGHLIGNDYLNAWEQDLARSIREADTAAGLALVPLTHTNRMHDAGVASFAHGVLSATWSAMVAASPFASGVKRGAECVHHRPIPGWNAGSCADKSPKAAVCGTDWGGCIHHTLAAQASARLDAGISAAELPATVPANAVDAACAAYWDAEAEAQGHNPWNALPEGGYFRHLVRKKMRSALAAFGNAMASPVDGLVDDVETAAEGARGLAALVAAWDAFELGAQVPERLDPGRVPSTLNRLAFLLEVTLERLGEAQAGAALNSKWLGEAHRRANSEAARADKAEDTLARICSGAPLVIRDVSPEDMAEIEREIRAPSKIRHLEPAALASIGLGAVVLADTPEGRPPCYLAAADVLEVNRGICTSKVFGSACAGCGFRLCTAQADAVREEC